MRTKFFSALVGLTLGAAPLSSQLFAQDEDSQVGNEIVVTAQRRNVNVASAAVDRRPIIGLRRIADSAARNIEISSDSREEDMRNSEVRAMLLAALDRAKAQGLVLVTGQYELVEVTRANWQDHFPELSSKPKDDDEVEEDDDDNDDENSKAKPGYEDSGSTTTIRLKVKTKLEGSISAAQQKISKFVKGVPATGRSVIEQIGGLLLTIINPEQYRDEIYRRISAGAKRAQGFYGADYGVTVTGLDREIAWAQVSNTEVFLYIPYSFVVEK